MFMILKDSQYRVAMTVACHRLIIGQCVMAAISCEVYDFYYKNYDLLRFSTTVKDFNFRMTNNFV